MSTETLISDLAAAAKPVRPLARPEVRAVAWFGFALAAVVVVMAVHGIDGAQFQHALTDPRTIGEVIATLVTAVSAAVVAFRSTVPGASRRWFWVPFAGLAAWVLLTGAGCAADYARMGPAAFTISVDTACFVPGAAAVTILTAVVLFMLKRGAPLVPRQTLWMAGKSVTATVNAGLLLLHEGDVSIMLLTWHTAYVVVLAGIGAWVAPALFGWQRRSAVPTS